MTDRLAVYAGLMAFAAVVILLAKSNVLFPRPFNETTQKIFGLPAGSSKLVARNNLFGWGLIALGSYLIAVLMF